MTPNTPTVLCVGHCTLDTIGLVDHVPASGGKVEIREFTVQGGGAAATAGVALARLGVNTRFVGKVGDDERGDTIRRSLTQDGVAIDDLIVQRGATSQFSFVVVELPSRRRQTYWTRGTIATLTANELGDHLLDGVDLLLVDGFHPQAQSDLARRAHDRGITVLFDAGQFAPGLEPLVAHSDIIIASERFAMEFCGVGQPKAALDKLRQSGPSIAVITMGVEGSIGKDDSSMHLQPPMRIGHERDNTGAGDVYRGAFALAALHKQPLGRAMAFATAAATLRLRTLGGRQSMPDLDEVHALLARTPLAP